MLVHVYCSRDKYIIMYKIEIGVIPRVDSG